MAPVIPQVGTLDQAITGACTLGIKGACLKVLH